MITSLGIKILQTTNDKILNQLKHKKLANRTNQMRLEKIEQWFIDLGENPHDVASIQDLMKTKDTEIHVLKKNLKIPGVDHVQTPELQRIHQEKDQLLRKIVQMKD
jgi:hypothetical protein